MILVISSPDMRKRADTLTLTGKISLDCENFQLAAVNMLLKKLKQ